MCFIYARLGRNKRLGFDIVLVAVVLHGFKFLQLARDGLVSISVSWRFQAIVNTFKLAHVHFMLLAINLYKFANLKAYVLCVTYQLHLL